MLFKEKEKHPWSCDMSKGDVQCPFVTPNGDGYLNCTWKIGHPLGLLQHEVVHDQPTPPPNRKWFNFQGGETKDDKPYTANDPDKIIYSPKFVFSGWRSPGETEKVVVPGGMLDVAMQASMNAGLAIGPSTELRVVLKAALLWQKTNSPKPTQQQALELRNLALAVNRNYGSTEPTAASCAAVAVDWVGRMYDAPEPARPEDVQRFANISDETMAKHEWIMAEDYDVLLKAFRDLQKSTTGR